MIAARHDTLLTQLAGGLVLAACLLCLAAPAALHARSAEFAPLLNDADTTLVRLGQGTAHYARLVAIYDAALYLETDADPRDVLDPAVSKRLDIVYRVPIKASDMIRAAERTLTKQNSKQVLARWQPQLDALHAAYRDVQRGDRYALEFRPRGGLRLEFNGERVAQVDEPEFANLYLAIWFGEPPLSEPLKRALMNPAADKAR